MNNHTKNLLSITIVLVFLMMGLCSPVAGDGESRSAVEGAPKISSSLAKNLWRQAHFYFEEGLYPQAIRACEELLAWAQENERHARDPIREGADVAAYGAPSEGVKDRARQLPTDVRLWIRE